MRTARWMAALAVVVLLGGVHVGWAQGAQGAAEAPQVVKVLVKQYKTLSAANVYRAALAGAQANVRFGDAFGSRTVVPDALRRVELEGRAFLPVLAFRTQGDLVCLVARSNMSALRSLLGLPEDWPLSDTALGQALALNRGQRITVEGTVVGEVVGDKYVLADAVWTGEKPEADVQRELHLSWGNSGVTQTVTKPGAQVLQFPCSYKADESESMKVVVTEVDGPTLLAQLARIAAVQEGIRAAVKEYGQYQPEDVYRSAGDEGGVNVDFVDTVATVRRERLPEALSTVPALRAGRPVDLPVSQAFDTGSRITCLVPVTARNLSAQVVSALPGEKVRVRGTTVGRRGAANCVLVDYMGFLTGEETEPKATWLVSIDYVRVGTMTFWDYGFYAMPDLPCQHVAGRYEVLRLLLGDFRTVELKPQVQAAPAPAAR